MPVYARKDYPTALPHRSAEEASAQELQLRQSADRMAVQAARLRRWTALLLAGTGLALLTTAGIVWLAIQRRSAGVEGAVAASAPVSDANANSSGTAARNSGEFRYAPPAAPPKEPTRAADKLKALEPVMHTTTASTEQKDLFLEALGGLSATNLYQNYLLVGLLADGVESKSMSVEGATTTLKIVTDCLTLVEGKLAKLGTTRLDAEDLDSLQHIKSVAGLLRLEAQALRNYWATGEAEQQQQYQQARRAAWTGLSKVLGLDRK